MKKVKPCRKRKAYRRKKGGGGKFMLSGKPSGGGFGLAPKMMAPVDTGHGLAGALLSAMGFRVGPR